MADGFAEEVRGFLLDPVETFRRSRADSFESAFVYFVILILINAVLTALVSLLGFGTAPWSMGAAPAAGLVSFVVSFFGSLIGNIVLLFVGGLIVHLFVILVGGRMGVVQTLKAFIYGDTPVMLLGWIPIVGFLAFIYTVFLWIIGIRELHQISTLRAALAVLIPVVIALVLLALLVAALVLLIAEIAQEVPGLTV